ncbi:MAG: hypothetical protein K0Q79_2556 [Flavipsychrobacter sp.]|jgi:LPS export ABC transporter protein LptC|nr:hypothetical protein [Flavipsychrobacter sp.]
MINLLRKYHLNNITRILVPGVLFIAIASCKNDPGEIDALTGRGSKQEDKAENVTLIYSKDGKVKLRAYAKYFIRNESANPAFIDMNRDLKAEFFDSSGKVEHVLTADSSRYYTDKGDVIVWDSVKVLSATGQELTTPELIWSNSIQKFFTEKPVKIASASEVLYGEGLEANSDFSWYQILRPRGTVAVNKGEVPK